MKTEEEKLIEFAEGQKKKAEYYKAFMEGYDAAQKDVMNRLENLLFPQDDDL